MTDQTPTCKLCGSVVLNEGELCLSCATLRQQVILNPDLAVKILRKLEEKEKLQ